jgi:putative acetyltransferase
MTIREALPSDRETLVTIWLRSVRATHTLLSEDDIQSLLPFVREELRGQSGLELWILVADASAVIGFLGLSGSDVAALFLDPDYLRRGGGRMLLAHARRLKGALSVDVNEQNPEAVRFYESSGFETVGRSPVDDAGRPFPILHMRQSQGLICALGTHDRYLA